MYPENCPRLSLACSTTVWWHLPGLTPIGSTLPVTFPYVTISSEILTYLLGGVLPLTDEEAETEESSNDLPGTKASHWKCQILWAELHPSSSKPVCWSLDPSTSECDCMKVDSLEKTWMLGGTGGRRRRGRQRMRWLDSITDSVDVSLSEL